MFEKYELNASMTAYPSLPQLNSIITSPTQQESDTPLQIDVVTTSPTFEVFFVPDVTDEDANFLVSVESDQNSRRGRSLLGVCELMSADDQRCVLSAVNDISEEGSVDMWATVFRDDCCAMLNGLRCAFNCTKFKRQYNDNSTSLRCTKEFVLGICAVNVAEPQNSDIWAIVGGSVGGVALLILGVFLVRRWFVNKSSKTQSQRSNFSDRKSLWHMPAVKGDRKSLWHMPAVKGR